jgi:hypothetical protein
MPFYSPYRRKQFHALMQWLGENAVPMIVYADGWTLPHRADGIDRIDLAVMNVNNDTWKDVQLKCHVKGTVHNIIWLDTQGIKRELDKSLWQQNDEQVSIRIHETIPPLMTVACILIL